MYTGRFDGLRAAGSGLVRIKEMRAWRRFCFSLNLGTRKEKRF